jgi:Eukaryotic initiation factor 4E
MQFGTILHIFAEGVKPMWEDEHCKDGSKWSFKLSKWQTNKYWEDLLLALIGNTFTDENEVHGLIVTLRYNFDTIQVWNKSGKDKARIETLKKDIETILELPAGSEVKLEYENFAEALARYNEKKNAPANDEAPRRQWKENTHTTGGTEESWGRGRGAPRGGYRGGYDNSRGRGYRGGVASQ